MFGKDKQCHCWGEVWLARWVLSFKMSGRWVREAGVWGMSAVIACSEVARLDAELMRLSRGMSAVRLRVGEALQMMGSRRGHHELGFSSLAAYALERCERSSRWAADTRALARKLERLPRLRAALRAGAVSWSVADELARLVTAETEEDWIERARHMTVRELRQARAGSESHDREEEECLQVLTVTVPREDAWLFECARRVAEHSGAAKGADSVLRALLAEGLSSMLQCLPEDRRDDLLELEALEATLEAERVAHAAWCAERENWRVQAERRGVGERVELVSISPETSDGPLPQDAVALDQELGRLCAELAERDLALGAVACSARAAEVWRTLGFVSEEHYVRERLGVSLSSLKSKRTLAGRAAQLPELGEALLAGLLGYEAAQLVARVATRTTVSAWIARAGTRTVKHLREEVDAVELRVRLGQSREQWPPDELAMQTWSELERCVASGEILDKLTANDSQGVLPPASSQMSGGDFASFGCVTFRWHVSADTCRYWRALERVFQRVGPAVGWPRVSFLWLLCDNFCRIWLPVIRRERLTEGGTKPAYFEVYERDAFRCTSPVCSRRDVTPHHLRFRSAGGGDELENLTTLCVWCHLEGIHGGRLAAAPPASNIDWRIGRNATVRVTGRERQPKRTA
jgi:hypothetical protein